MRQWSFWLLPRAGLCVLHSVGQRHDHELRRQCIPSYTSLSTVSPASPAGDHVAAEECGSSGNGRPRLRTPGIRELVHMAPPQRSLPADLEEV